ncbi:MAG: hypothetical protein ACPL06_02685 [Candidatus Anstonellales archaeon]
MVEKRDTNKKIQELKEELERTKKELLEIKRAIEILKEKNWK